jgi:uncharacterized cupin superfamily protein
MEQVTLEEVPPAALSTGHGRYALDDALGATDLAVKYYHLEPGEVFSGGYHTHESQEEIFIVLEGEATWDTEDGEASMTLSAGEAVRFAPGEFQHGYVDEDREEGVRALALGAPPGMDETVSRFVCPACEQQADHDVDLDAEARVTTTTCRNCGNELRTELD